MRILIIVFLCSLVLYAQKRPSFDIHFAVLTKNQNAHKKATLEQLKKEVEILNRYFVSYDGEKIFDFRFKSASFYDDIKTSSCAFIQIGDFKKAYDKNWVKKNYFECEDAKVRDKKALNFYVIDSYSPLLGFEKYTTSRGAFHDGANPFILLDWKRLNHTNLSPEEHEMGHAFGLGHTCDPDAKANTSTNIMSSSSNCSGKTGLRNLGFSKEQIILILKHAKIIQLNFFNQEQAIDVGQGFSPSNTLNTSYNLGETFSASSAKDYQYLYQYGKFRIFYSLDGKNALLHRKDNDNNGIPDNIESAMYQLVTLQLYLEQIMQLVSPFVFDYSPFVLWQSKFIDVKVRAVKAKAYTSNKNIKSKFFLTKEYGLHRGSVISITLNRNFTTDNLILFHELLHVYQNTKTRLRNDWFSEGTARWIENSVLGKKISSGVLPQNKTALEKLFLQGYQASRFWNHLGTFCLDNSAKTIEIKNSLEKIVFPVNRLQFTSKDFYRTLLDNLFKQTLVATKEKEFNNALVWPIKAQKDFSNNPYIVKALYDTVLTKCVSNRDEIKKFKATMKNYLEKNYKG